MNALAKYFKDSEYINLSVYDKELLKKYNVIWNKINSLFKNSEPLYKDKYIKTKVNLYSTLFLDKRVSKKECYAWNSVLLLDSIVNVNKKYYPLVFLYGCKYVVRKEKIKIVSAIDEELIIDGFNDNEYDKFNKD